MNTIHTYMYVIPSPMSGNNLASSTLYSSLQFLLYFSLFSVMDDVNDRLVFQQSVLRYFGESFTPAQLLVVTWNNVGYYNTQTDKVCMGTFTCMHVLSLQTIGSKYI